MSVAQISSRQFGLFVALQIKGLDAKPTDLAILCTLAAHVSDANAMAWSQRYSDTIEPCTESDIEREALSILASRDSAWINESFFGFSGNVWTSTFAEFEGEQAAEMWTKVLGVEKACREWQNTQQRELKRREENDQAFIGMEPLATLSKSEIQAKAEGLEASRVIVAQYHVDESDGCSDYYGSRLVRTVVIGFGRGKRESFKQLRQAAEKFEPTSNYAPGNDIFTARVVYDLPEQKYILGQWRYDGSWSNAHSEIEPERDTKFLTEAEARAFTEAAGAPRQINTTDQDGDDLVVNFRWDISSESFEHRENYSMGGGNYLGRSRYDGWKVSSQSVEYFGSGTDRIEFFEAPQRLPTGQTPSKPKPKPKSKAKPAIEVEVVETSESERGKSYQLKHNKTQAYVHIGKDGSFDVTCMNAAHSAWRGGGNYFANFEAANQHYRSKAMKAILSKALELSQADEQAETSKSSEQPEATAKTKLSAVETIDDGCNDCGRLPGEAFKVDCSECFEDQTDKPEVDKPEVEATENFSAVFNTPWF